MTFSPFIFDVSALLRGAGLPVQQTNSGPSPARVGLQMLAIAEKAPVSVAATLTPLGEGVMVDAEVTAEVTGQCVRCLRDLRAEQTFEVHEVFAATDSFIQGEDAGDDDEVPRIVHDRLDLLQSVIDAAGLALPFNPTCVEVLGEQCAEDEVPAPDGISGEQVGVDPRWAGLEKFK